MSCPVYISRHPPCYAPDLRTLWRRFWAWLNFMRPALIDPNPLPILMRAIGRVRRGLVRQQPRWKRGRWRSTT